VGGWRIYFPTLRKRREGWGTRTFVLGEEEQQQEGGSEVT
jgi:hypothetical protein